MKMPLDLTNPDDKKAFDEALSTALKESIEKETKALKDKNEEILGEKKKLQDQLKKFDGMDFDAVKKLQERMEKDEELRLLAEGRSDEVFNKRFERIRNDYDSQLEKTTKERDEARLAAETATAQAQRNVAEVHLRREAEKAGVVGTAIDDVVRRGLDLFGIEEDGSLLQRDKDKKIVTIDGKNATPEAWLEKLKEQAPHFWPASTDATRGGGGGGGGGGGRSNFEEQMAKAVAKGDMKQYREIRNKMRGIETK
jgi:hypothetical protein